MKITAGRRVVAHAVFSGMSASIGFFLFLGGYFAISVSRDPSRLEWAASRGGLLQMVLSLTISYGIWGLPFLLLAGVAVGPFFALTSRSNRVQSAFLAVPVGILGTVLATRLRRWGRSRGTGWTAKGPSSRSLAAQT